MSRLCVTVTGASMAELRQRRDLATEADLVELRLDTVEDPDAAGALAGRSRPVIVTCRPRWEGGHFGGSEEERRRLLADAQRLGAEYVDVEWRAGFTDLIASRRGEGVVVSMHDFTGVPRDLAARAEAMRSTGAAVVKLAVRASNLSDCLELLPIGRSDPSRLVLIAMGEAGLPSRVLASRFGSAWTYAGDYAAPGQVPARQLLDEFGYRALSPHTQLFGVVGRPVLHSLSPAMHNAAFRAAGIDAIYVPLQASNFNDFIAFADAMAVVGASVTAPYKLDAFQHATEADETSRAVGASNTLRRRGAGWDAINTDVAGFLQPLVVHGPMVGRRCVVLGGGGAARAVVYALQQAGARVAVSSRRPEAAQSLAERSGATVAHWPPPAGSWDVLINTTPLGTAPDVDDTPLPDGPFGGTLVYDLVYNPADTRLLRDARAAGCQTIGGLAMLVAQAERQFEWWTGQRPREGVMREPIKLSFTPH
jgi:3-dehydroquinate dehydratase / shikimate dehydrogenase